MFVEAEIIVDSLGIHQTQSMRSRSWVCMTKETVRKTGGQLYNRLNGNAQKG